MRRTASSKPRIEGGSFAPGAEAWFIKLEYSTDQLLARAWPWRRKPIFLQCIDDPESLVTYLQDLTWSDIARCGRDNRKELNEAISVIARLVMRGGQAGYLNGPGLIPAFERFVRGWQDPGTGFFGMTYLIEEQPEIRTKDLSLYLSHAGALCAASGAVVAAVDRDAVRDQGRSIFARLGSRERSQ